MIVNQDCLEYLKTLENDSVDLVLTDPPYFIGFDGGKGWDSQWKSEDEYLVWCADWTQECIRVLKPNRMLIVWGTLKTETFIKYKGRVKGCSARFIYCQSVIRYPVNPVIDFRV